MAGGKYPAITGFVVDETTTLTLDELAQACSVHVEWLVELVDEGVLQPRGDRPEHWQFSGTVLARARTAVRLQHDLQLDTAAVAVVLDLLEELEELRERLRAPRQFP